MGFLRQTTQTAQPGGGGAPRTDHSSTPRPPPSWTSSEAFSSHRILYPPDPGGDGHAQHSRVGGEADPGASIEHEAEGGGSCIH
jgi:hypothetical protein